MCGITGIFAYGRAAAPVDPEELLRIREAMAIRGPDGEGLWVSGDRQVGLAHRRLAIIDLSDAGAQPMATADGRYHITFNGEIYNYLALRKELEAKGYRFRSNSDTEVLLHLYADRGVAMVQVLRGMYAFGIFDQRDRSLFLARDPFGIKPLYYADNGNTLRFASQVKALLKADGIDTSPAAAGHVGFYLWGHVPDPHTLFKGIKAVPAGTTLTIDAHGRRTAATFFNPSEEFARANEHRRQIPLEEVNSRLQEALKDTVRHHLVADVPVGVFLSSGLDSATITALAAESGPADLRTLTLGFEEYRGTRDDETPLAEQIARSCGTRHQTHWISKLDFDHDLDRLLEMMDQPSIDGVNTYFVSRAAARDGMKVALSGLGGDELFGGYPSFRELPRLVRALSIGRAAPGLGKALRWATAPFLRRFTSPKYAGILEYGGSFAGAYLLRRALYMPWEIPEVLDSETVREGWNELQTLPMLAKSMQGIGSDFQRISALELSWYMRNQLLRDADWAGMAHSLEIRVPIVDVELFRNVALLGAGEALTKAHMARAPGRALSASVLERRKTGFSIPVHEWVQRRGGGVPHLRGLRAWARTVNPPPPRKSRVLALVIDAFGGHGGIALYNRDMLNALCDHPGTGEVVALPRLMMRPPEPLPSSLRYDTSGLEGKGSYAWAVLRTLARDRRFDLIACAHINLLPLAYLAHLVTRAPIVLFVYGIDAWEPTRSRLSNFLVSRIAAYISISEITRNRFLAWAGAGEARGYLLPNAIHLKDYAPGEKDPALLAKYGLQGKLVLMTLGRLVSAERYKGFDEVLEALPELAAEHRDIAYLIAGTGSDQRRLADKAKVLGVEDRVAFTGYVPEEQKAAHYRLADAYVMPSHAEGFGFVLLEAMASGVPTVASRTDGGREALRDGMLGALVDPENREDLKRAIVAALQTPKHVPEGLEYFSYANFRVRLHRIIDEWLENDAVAATAPGLPMANRETADAKQP